ncbi:vacuolar protein sorting-associated protein, partial [Thraustotheca clavata]
MLEGYVHALLKSVLGTYVDLNEDSEALRLSVWKGQVELRDLSLKVDAFEPYLASQPFAVACGCIGFLKLQVPLINLGSSPIQVHIQDVMLLLRPRQELAHQNTQIKESTKAMAKEYLLQAKRTTLQALEQEGKQVPPAQSTFFSRLLTKLLDNLQIQIERLHIRIEDTISCPNMPFSLGITLDDMIIKSIDASGKYTLQVREKDAASCLRKRFELARFGVYFTPHYQAVTYDNNVGQFLSQMHNLAWNNQPEYMVKPVTISMNVIMNDRGVIMPMTSQAFSQRIIQRLGIVWMRDTIDAITPERWDNFINAMPVLTNGKVYTLSFVFCEAWSLALDDVDVDEVPTLEEFQAALCSCFQWSNVDDLHLSTKLFHAAALRVL